jgi:hypothetical protein
VTTFSSMLLEGRHTAIFMHRNKQSVIHQSLYLRQSLELKFFLVSQWCTMTHVPGHTLHIFPECWIVIPYRIYCTWSTGKKVQSIWNYWLPGNNRDCHFLKKGISQKLTKDILSNQPCVQGFPQTHTNKHTHAQKHTNKYTQTHTHSLLLK